MLINSKLQSPFFFLFVGFYFCEDWQKHATVLYARFCNYVEKKKFVSSCALAEFGYHELVANVAAHNGDGGSVGGALASEMNIFSRIARIFRVRGSFSKLQFVRKCLLAVFVKIQLKFR